MADKKRDKPTEEIKDEELEKTQGGAGSIFNTATRFNTAGRFNTVNRLGTATGIDPINDLPTER